MKLMDVIRYADRIKPNAFSDEDKARWVSEAEGLVATEVMLLDPGEFKPYVLSASYHAAGVCFPDERTLRLAEPVPDEFSVGGMLTLTGGSMYAENSSPQDAHRIMAISADGCELTLDAEFPAVGRDPDTAAFELAFDGAETVLMLRPPHDKVYPLYLIAQIDFANGEYNKYQNAMQMFNAAWGELCRWWARNFRPADRDPSATGAYLSAYRVAVNHGFRGTEEDWLISLKGDAGSSGVWISDDLTDAPDGDRHLWFLRDEEEGEEITVPDGLSYAGGMLRLMDGTEPVGDPVPVIPGLPAVTSADNGCILKVVNGVWTKVVPT